MTHIHLTPLETRSEFNARMDKLQESTKGIRYGLLILSGLVTQSFFTPILLWVPFWIIDAVVYTQIYNHHERVYKQAIDERKRHLTNLR